MSHPLVTYVPFVCMSALRLSVPSVTDTLLNEGETSLLTYGLNVITMVSITNDYHYQSRYCDVTTTTALCNIKKPKCFGTHTDTVETLFVNRLFQHVVSGWKATENKLILPSQDRLQQWTP